MAAFFRHAAGAKLFSKESRHLKVLLQKNGLHSSGLRQGIYTCTANSINNNRLHRNTSHQPSGLSIFRCTGLHNTQLTGLYVVPSSATQCRQLSFWPFGGQKTPDADGVTISVKDLSAPDLSAPDLSAPASAVGSSDAQQAVTEAASAAASSIPQVPSLPEGYIPDVPSLPTAMDQVLQVGAENLTKLGEPTLASLGLCNYTPAGLVQTVLEAMHVTADLPWWGSIVLATLFLRLLMFPIVIKSQKNSINMTNNMPTFQRLQEQATQARQRGDLLEAARKQQQALDYLKTHEVNPAKVFMMPMMQVPVFISVFVGLRGMASLPVMSMSTGGILWFTDLTVPDPMWLLPLLASSSFLATIELGSEGVKAGSQTMMVKYVMRAMPLVMFPFILNFPAAMLCYWVTSNLFSLSQAAFLKIPKVRTYFNIPKMVKHEKSGLPTKPFKEGFRDSWSNAKNTAKMEERSRADEIAFRKAGEGPIKKTYSYDPTKAKSKAAARAK